MTQAMSEQLISHLGPWLLHGYLFASTPLAGRLAFASVFILLIAWLLWIPSEKLQAGAIVGQDGKLPSVVAIRYSAVAIAAVQVLLYLFWN